MKISDKLEALYKAADQAKESQVKTYSLVDVMKGVAETVAPGLANFKSEIGAELGRLGTQGASEVANAIFGGSAFTIYGSGQQPAEPEKAQENERGGRDD